MKLTKKQAKELSIKKWEYIVGNNGKEDGLIKACPELEKLIAHCGYCEIYIACDKCPIYFKKGEFRYGCGSELHPWDKWSCYHTKSNAQRVLDLIKQS